MSTSGLLSWANSVRLTMATDPGRQLFKEHVQTHGFLFLDDYLDNIISETRKDPLIELVKTPGRKKAIMRKPQLFTSKLGEVLTVEEDVEDVASSNPLQKLMFPEDPAGTKPALFTDEWNARDSSAPSPFIITTQQAVSTPDSAQSSHHREPNKVENSRSLLLPSSSEPHDLSVIAEDDESSNRSLLPTPSAISEPSGLKPSQSILLDVDRSFTHTSTNHYEPEIPIVSASSSRSFHPATELALQNGESEAMDISFTDAPPVQLRTSTRQHEDFFDQEMDIIEEVVPLIEDKQQPPAFPSLPEPMPLRKSTRHPIPAQAVLLGAATPGAPSGGKRTSWLMKAREVKALEVTVKKHDMSIDPALTGNKRKSEDTQPGVEQLDRQSKALKTTDGQVAPHASKRHERKSSETGLLPVAVEDHEDGALDLLKKTVEGLGARVPKNSSKSFGGGIATALAEAKAAAEAKVAERGQKEEEMTMATQPMSSQQTRPVWESQEQAEPLRVSDLFPKEGRIKEKHKVQEKPFVFQPEPYQTKEPSVRSSTSTTPPHSPQVPPSTSFSFLGGPVFKKPPVVFVPPPALNNPPSTSESKSASAFSTTAMGLAPRLPILSSPPHAKPLQPLTAHSTVESVESDVVFDDTYNVPAWMPGTQDTEYTTAYGSQSQPAGTQICDEDDSWPIDEKLSAGVQWTFGSKEDSLTWSTLPSQSQRGDTGPITKTSIHTHTHTGKELHHNPSVPGAFDAMEEEPNQEAVSIPRDHELEEIILSAKAAPVNESNEPKSQSSQSQLSGSSASSQEQTGFLGQATKIIANALGTSKKAKQPEVKKVLQMAAVAAKKQQEEADKKAARLKEMDIRRQQAVQRKAEEEKAKALEEERRMKEDTDRRKREREETGDKRTAKQTLTKKDDEGQKKRKLEGEKTIELKKFTPAKGPLKSALKQPSTLNVSTSHQQQNVAGPSSDSKGKNQAAGDDDVSQPAMLLQSQMAARAKAQLDAAKHPVPSESIELPDINSEYSDSEDEDRPRTFDPPDWAQSPELRQALEMQSTINPDDIFGAVRPLKMEEMFKSKTNRFRSRTSSANWTGADRLTVQEEREYARRMGFK